jgi:hypothetical protein
MVSAWVSSNCLVLGQVRQNLYGRMPQRPELYRLKVRWSVALVSCNPEQRCHEGIGVAAAENRQKALCTTRFLSQKSPI